MNFPLVSVVIPVYNASEFIIETVESVLSQTWKQLEIIIVNDGSTDDTLDKLKAYSTNVKVKVYTQKNQGSPIAKNYGLSMAKGEFIQFLDADDILSPGKIEKQVCLLLRNPLKVAVCRTKTFQNIRDINEHSDLPEIDTSFLYTTDDPISFLMQINGVNSKSAMVQPNAYLTPKKLVDKAGHWSLELNRSPDDDSEFFCRVLIASQGLVYEPEGVNYYRRFSDYTLSKQRNYENAEGAFKTILLKYSHLSKFSNSNEFKIAMAKQFASFMYLFGLKFPEFIPKVKAEIKAIGLDYIPPVGGTYFKLLSYILGFEKTFFLKKIIHRKNKIESIV